MVSALRKLTSADRERIGNAIKMVESRTDANFSLIVVPSSERYGLYPITAGAIFAFLTAGIITLAWPDMTPRKVILAQGLIFVFVSFVFDWLPLRLLLVPRKVQRTEARELARSEFVARTFADRNRRIDVLFFVSLGERYVEIIAEQELHTRVGDSAWKEIVANFVAAAKSGRIADGFISAIEACGAILETHKPRI